MIIGLLIYSHIAAGLMGFLIYDWTVMMKTEFTKDAFALVILSLVWPFTIWAIYRHGVK
jgi:hypothetical protein